MSTSPITSTEKPIVPKRRLRRIGLIATVALIVLATGWIGLVVMDRKMRSDQVAQNMERMRAVVLSDDATPMYANQRIAQTYTPSSQLIPQPSSAPTAVLNPQLSTAQATGQNNSYRQPNSVYYYSDPVQPPDPAESAAANEITQLRNQLRTATGDQKKELSKSLNEAVGKLFDLRHAAQAKQVEKLETELAEAKELLKKRGDRKEEIVQRRIAELLQAADDLAWNREIGGQPSATRGYPGNQTFPPASMQPAQPSYQGNYPGNYSGSYQVVPYTNPLVPPQTQYQNSFPASSTPPQFIPLNTQGPGRTSLLQSTPSLSNTNSTYPSTSPLASGMSSLPPVGPNKVTAFVPDFAVSSFLNFLHHGDAEAASQLLTSKAREEMAKAKKTIRPPGKPETEFHMGSVRFPTNEKDFAVVDVTWSEPGLENPSEAVFECRIEEGGWHIVGMAVKSNNSETRISFEDPLSAEPTNSLLAEVTEFPQAEKEHKEVSATASNALVATKSDSKSVIEAAYAYADALDVAIDTKKLHEKGVLSKQELAAKLRGAEKAKAIWAATIRDLEKLQKSLKEEYAGKSALLNENMTRERRTGLQTELQKIELELKSISESQEFADSFEKQSLDQIEKQIEISEEKKVDEKTDVPSSVPSTNN